MNDLNIQEIFSSYYFDLISIIYESLPRLIVGILIVMAIIYCNKILNKFIKKILEKSKAEDIDINLYIKISKIFFYFISIIVFLNIIGLKSVAAAIFASGGIVTIIIGLAFKDIGENVLSGILLGFNRPFKKGDLIKSGEFEGVVKEILVRNTHIRTVSGEDIFIPSSNIYKNALINYTRDGLRRFKITLGISYKSNISDVIEIIETQLKTVDGILPIPNPSISMGNILENYLEIDIYFWIDVLSKNGSLSRIRTQLIAKIKDELSANDIDLSCDISKNINFKPISESYFNEGLAH